MRMPANSGPRPRLMILTCSITPPKERESREPVAILPPPASRSQTSATRRVTAPGKVLSRLSRLGYSDRSHRVPTPDPHRGNAMRRASLLLLCVLAGSSSADKPPAKPPDGKPLEEKVKEIAGSAEFLNSVPKHF